jgi:hypothetical protein
MDLSISNVVTVKKFQTRTLEDRNTGIRSRTSVAVESMLVKISATSLNKIGELNALLALKKGHFHH